MRVSRFVVVVAFGPLLQACDLFSDDDDATALPAPTVSLSANPTTVSAGGGSTALTWSSTDATSCVAGGGWTGSRPLSGSESITVNQPTTFSLTCTGAGGTGSAQVMVAVQPPAPVPAPTVSLSASSTTVPIGGNTALAWSSTDATSCVAGGGWTGSRPTSGSASIAVNQPTTFSLTCTGAGGTGSAQVTVAVQVPPPPAPTVSLSANPTTVPSGGGSTALAWSSTDATSCVAGGGWTGSRPTSGSASITVNQPTTFSLTCTGAGGIGSAQVTVAVQPPPPPAPTVSLSANPTTVAIGGSTALAWSSTNATSCVASDGWTGSRPTSGSESIAVSQPTTFSLTCTGVGGTGSAQVTVAVQVAPTVSLSANPTTAPIGGSTVLTWSSTNATSCVAGDGWTGSRPTSGSESIAVSQQTTFSLTCTGAGGTGSAQVAVAVQAAPTVSLSANPTIVPAGGGTTALAWSSTDATSCVAGDGWTGSRPASGSESATVNQQTTFSLTCTGAGGTGSVQVTVTVATAPTVSLSANPTTVPAGGGSTALTWSSTDATSCVAGGGWTGPRPTSGSESIPVSQGTTFSLNCSGAGGTGSAQVTVAVQPPAPTVSLSADPTTVPTGGGDATLEWSSTNATSCVAGGGWTGSRPTSGSASVTVSQQTTFSLTCNGDGGTDSAQVTVAVQPPPPAPTVSLSADPTTVPAGGGSTDLTWSSTDATSCVAGGGWAGSRPTSGSESVTVNQETTFSLTCTGAGGTGSAQVTVAVQPAPPAPTVSLSADPNTVPTGGDTTLEWSSTNATSCVAGGGWAGSQPTSGSESVTVNQETTFSLTCTGAGGTGSAQVTVAVQPAPPAPTVSLSADPTTVPTGGGNTTLEWSSTNATSCVAGGGWTGSRSTSGSESIAVSQETTFSLNCSGAGGTGSAQVTVAVQPPAPVVGLDSRPSNLTCVAPVKASGNEGTTIALQRAFPNLTFNQPVAMLQAPGDDTRWFVLEKGSGSAGTARVRVFANTPNVGTATSFISLTVNADSEGGLLGMAFHPQWATNRQVFLSYTQGTPMVSYVARYTSNDDGFTLDPNSRQEIIRVNQPFDNHNGGQIAFGPDGFLYFGLGDGGSGGDPINAGQDTTDLLGSMLRLDVDAAAPYTIPLDNPFAQTGGTCGPDHSAQGNDCAEIYAWGLRNPWRWSFDSATGYLWVGDVGQSAREEIDRVERGGNYGWNCREGFIAYSGRPASCPATAATFDDPVHDYGRSLGASVTGGYVYRGAALPTLFGRYVFADFVTGFIWRLVDNGSGGFDREQLLDTSLSIASFGEGNDGELYVIDIGGGGLHKIVDGGGAPPPGPPVPTLLSDTGCVNEQSPSQPASGLIPYAPAAPFWSDNAAKERWLAIPNGTSIAVGSDGDFTFPNGTVLMKHFRLGGNLIETRLFMRHPPDGEWAGYTYEWQGADATLVQGGKTVAIGSQDWIFPSENDCLTCHTAAAGFALGLETAQLNNDFLYTSTNRTANQLRTLDHVAMFTTPLGDPALQPAMPDPFDATAPLGQRARAYLHTNCAQCHRPNGPTPSSMDLRYATLLSATNACDVSPQSGDLGLGAAARIIAPGSAAHSVLAARIDRRDANGMPPLASNVVDTAGVQLIGAWITSLTTCQ